MALGKHHDPGTGHAGELLQATLLGMNSVSLDQWYMLPSTLLCVPELQPHKSTTCKITILQNTAMLATMLSFLTRPVAHKESPHSKEELPLKDTAQLLLAAASCFEACSTCPCTTFLVRVQVNPCAHMQLIHAAAS
eukprot:1142435-Pelagomonas_calceolata.AAC.5